MVQFSIEDDKLDNVLTAIQSYYKIICGNEIEFHFISEPKEDHIYNIPSYIGKHMVFPSEWSFRKLEESKSIIDFVIGEFININKYKDGNYKIYSIALNSNSCSKLNEVESLLNSLSFDKIPKNENRLQEKDMVKYIIPPPPSISSVNSLEIPPKNVCKIPPKLPPKSKKIRIYNTSQSKCEYLDELMSKINSQDSFSKQIECKDIFVLNHELIVNTSSLVTTSKILIQSISYNKTYVIKTVIDLCKKKIEKILFSIVQLKSIDLIYSNILLNKFKNILIPFNVLINSHTEKNQEAFRKQSEQLASCLFLFLQHIKSNLI